MYGIGIVRSVFRRSPGVGVRRVFSIPCRESAVTAPSLSFPWLAVIPGEWGPSKDEMTFISHTARNDRTYKLPLPCGNINFQGSRVSSNNKGWMMFLRNDSSLVPMIFNPLTGAQLQPLPSLHNFIQHRYPNCKYIDFEMFLTDNHVAFVKCSIGQPDYPHILVAATPGDDEWSSMPLPSPFFSNHLRSIVFHEAEDKFYYLDRGDQMQSFRLTRSHGRKTVFSDVSSILGEKTKTGMFFLEQQLYDSHLVSHGTNLFRLRKSPNSTKFDTSEYCPCGGEDNIWGEVTSPDLGDNSFFVDQYGARLLRNIQREGEEEEKGMPRRNCIYFTHYDHVEEETKDGDISETEYYSDIEEGKITDLGCEIDHDQLYLPCVRVYDVDKDTVEPCFSTPDVPSNYELLPDLMWFTPINN